MCIRKINRTACGHIDNNEIVWCLTARNNQLCQTLTDELIQDPEICIVCQNCIRLGKPIPTSADITPMESSSSSSSGRADQEEEAAAKDTAEKPGQGNARASTTAQASERGGTNGQKSAGTGGTDGTGKAKDAADGKEKQSSSGAKESK